MRGYGVIVKLAGFQIKTNAPQNEASSYLLRTLAGDESGASNSLIFDFVLLARKLEKLGFVYVKGKIVIVDPDEVVCAGS